jgi:hypothetical protein
VEVDLLEVLGEEEEFGDNAIPEDRGATFT